MELLAKAEAKRERTVTLIIAAEKGKAKGVAAELRKLGGTVVKQVDGVGYLRAQVPTGSVRKAAAVRGVAAVDLNEPIKMPKPDPDLRGKARDRLAAAGPGATTPAANPYMPTNETGAVAFKDSHKTWDGRGVTIGIMDSGVDLDHPALQTTTTGERKIVDWFTATDPLVDADGTWRPMLTAVNGPTFAYAGSEWTAPAGSYRINQFTEAITAGGEPEGDVNRDGDTTDKFGILYDPASHAIRVDANQNRDFNDDAVMAPYKTKFDVGHFGIDKPETPVREQMPFVVEYREDVDLTPAGQPGVVADFVNIGIVESMHGTHVAGITAANDMLGNANFDGAAPGAKLVSARACSWSGGCTAAALIDGMTELVVNRKVDVVNMSIGGLPALNYANPDDARIKLYNRLINDYGVQLFLSAGNSGPGTNTVGDPSVTTDVVSVAAAVSKETWLSNYGSVVRKQQNLFPFSSRGPAEDGGFKPNITAPGSAISAAPLWQPGSGVPESGYPLPPGYQMANGTSMSSPQAAGAAALLLSAAKATDRGVTPAALRRAIYSSATLIDDVPVHAQGNGMFNVGGAWKLLEGGIQTRTYTVDAPVCNVMSDGLATPHRGTGIYNRCAAGAGGVKVNQPRNFVVKLTRTSGAKGRIAHNLRWIGNDGTFSSKQTVELGLNKTASIPVQVKATAGAHSAILAVDDPTTPAVDYEVLNTIVAGSEAKAPSYSTVVEGAVDRNSTRSYFVSVPEGAAALQVNLSGIATGSQTRFIAISPVGVPVDSTSSRECYTNFSDAAVCKPQARSYPNPMPGVWELEVESRRTSPALENPFKLDARIQGVTVTPPVINLPSVTKNEPTPLSWTLKNGFGPVRVSGKGGPLGSAVTSRPSIAEGAAHKYQIVVPEGATKLEVAIGKTSDLGADLDLTVRLNGAVVGQSADGDSEEAVSLANPAAGTYEVEVAGYAVPSGNTQYDYRDVFYAPSLGSVSAQSTPVTLANGATATVTGTLIAGASVAEGRQIFGEMTVVTDEGAVIGRGHVAVGAVK
jgi:subtilisin family serine protease